MLEKLYFSCKFFCKYDHTNNLGNATRLHSSSQDMKSAAEQGCEEKKKMMRRWI